MSQQSEHILIDNFLIDSFRLENELRMTRGMSGQQVFLNIDGALGGLRQVDYFNDTLGGTPGLNDFDRMLFYNQPIMGFTGRGVGAAIVMDVEAVGRGLDWSFLYNGSSSNPINVDLSNHDKVQLLWGVDNFLGESSITLSLTDQNGGSHSAEYIFPAGPETNITLTTNWDLSVFDSNGVDLTSITSIVLGGHMHDQQDIELTSFTIIPEPSTFALSVLGCSLLLFRRKR